MPSPSEIAREEGWGDFHDIRVGGRRVQLSEEQWDAAVDSGAKALVPEAYHWHELNDLYRDYLREQAKAVLEAALKPHRK